MKSRKLKGAEIWWEMIKFKKYVVLAMLMETMNKKSYK
jgi:hypothetical protein